MTRRRGWGAVRGEAGGELSVGWVCLRCLSIIQAEEDSRAVRNSGEDSNHM